LFGTNVKIEVFMFLFPIFHYILCRPCCSSEEEYTWRWAGQSEFLFLKVTPRMGADHMPNNVLNALTKLLSDTPDSIIVESQQTLST